MANDVFDVKAFRAAPLERCCCVGPRFGPDDVAREVAKELTLLAVDAPQTSEQRRLDV